MVLLCLPFLLLVGLVQSETSAAIAEPVKGTENLNFNKVWLVDYQQFEDQSMNFMYRGNSPIVNGTTFAYNELVQYMTIRANDAGLQFPSQFYFVDVSLENALSDGDNWRIEAEFWRKTGNDTDFGQLLHWPLAGSQHSPFCPNTQTKVPSHLEPTVHTAYGRESHDAGFSLSPLQQQTYRKKYPRAPKK